MASEFKPLGTRVLVKRIEEDEQKSEGGIFLPDSAKEKPQEAEVLALGNGKKDDGEDIEFSVGVGDKVLISKYGGTEIKIGRGRVPDPQRKRHSRDSLVILFSTQSNKTESEWQNNYHSTKKHATRSLPEPRSLRKQ